MSTCNQVLVPPRQLEGKNMVSSSQGTWHFTLNHKSGSCQEEEKHHKSPERWLPAMEPLNQNEHCKIHILGAFSPSALGACQWQSLHLLLKARD